MTQIEWTHRPGTKGESWNPIAGCSIVSPGCSHCYAMQMAARIERMGGPDHYRGLTQPSKAGPVWTGKVALAPDATLLKPLKAKAPRTYFVNSMSDLFHEDVPDAWIDRIFAVIAMTERHTYLVLTKRAERMRRYMTDPDMPRRVAAEGGRLMENGDRWLSFLGRDGLWPLRNLWLGVSAERQQEAEARIPHLMRTPAYCRFVSAEPLLGPIDLLCIQDDRGTPALGHGASPDWVIVGGESGPGARPMDLSWARSIRDQCDAAGVSFFMKQIDKKQPIPADLAVRQWPEAHQ
jgi:protein gp37